MKQTANNLSRWTKQDTTWMLSLFGTAVGAGILFLPINAGMGGFWPLVIMAVVVAPMTYLSHRGLARFVLSSKSKSADITEVVEEHFGKGAGMLITILYFFAIYPILLIYGNGITNTVDSFLVNQLGMPQFPRWALSLALIVGMMSIMMANRALALKVCEMLVYPLVAILAFMSIYLIPDWNMAALSFDKVPAAGDLLSVVWLTIPVLVFSFNHSPAISSFAVSQKEQYGDDAEHKSSLILKRTSTMLMGFVMLFVFSCVMSLSPEQLAEAKAQNLSILSYLANVKSSPFISYFGPIVAMAAIFSSFIGHYFGAREGLNGIIHKAAPKFATSMSQKKLDKVLAGFFLFTLWGVAIINPSILGMIESLGGPVIAAILFLMPMYAVRNIPALKQFKGQPSNIFVTVMGLLAISSILFGLLK
ncbi:serine/threonine transporter [Paraferrimonas sp. SM1919]|uniref:serine/threonine transporter n=1 Tax=Paraferrimonas sp. SM1919 TaxID=2662263 RepID=UPI0013D6F67F|nr:serine/threonine transporter [Paraferrimonas sp. SM1919]